MTRLVRFRADSGGFGAGYKVLDFDHESSGKVDKEIQLNFRGPLLGLGVRF
jgi:hypothetical protein